MCEKFKSETPVVQPRLVRRFEVINRIGEHEWEEASGPYNTYEEAEKARLNWFRKDDIPRMRVVEFHSPNVQAIAKMRQESLDAWAGKKLPVWKHIGELGEIVYMADGSHRWTLNAGYEDMRLFLVYLASGEVVKHTAYIDDEGTLCDQHGDDVGWAWYDAEYFMDIPVRPSLPNAEVRHGAKDADLD
jgi:hypothetical protein